jgi:glycosyltransferase involved in cell wall biosynthesis
MRGDMRAPCEVFCLDSGRLPNVQLDLNASWTDTKGFLDRLKICHIHLHHLPAFGPALVNWVEQVKANSALTVDFTAHDYSVFCPRTNCTDGSGAYCGEPDQVACQRCVNSNGTRFGVVDVAHWRTEYDRLLQMMRKVIVPSHDVLRRISQRFPKANLMVKPHPESLPTTPAKLPLPTADEPLRIAIIGDLGPHKGRDIVIACAHDALSRRLPLEFVIVGLSHDESGLANLPNVHIIGPFVEDQVLELIAQHRCHASFFGSLCPETYSYTLSIAMAANLFPFAFDLGAIAERLRALRWGKLIDFGLRKDAAKLNDVFLNTKMNGLERTPFTAYESLTGDYYELELQPSANPSSLNAAEASDLVEPPPRFSGAPI